MPHRRKSRRKFPRRRRKSRRRTTFKRKVLAVIQPERKVADAQYPSELPNSTLATIGAFNIISVGTAINGRIGMKINVTSLSATFFCAYPPTATIDVIIVRLGVWMWKQTIGGGLPLLADIYEQANSPCSFREKDTIGSFKLLWGRRFNMSIEPHYNTRCVAMNWKGNIPVRWESTSAAGTMKNLIFWTMQSTAAVGEPLSVDLDTRTRYTDM